MYMRRKHFNTVLSLSQELFHLTEQFRNHSFNIAVVLVEQAGILLPIVETHGHQHVIRG